MDANVRRDVVTLDSGGAARIPLAGEIQVVGALATNMLLADVFLSQVSPNSVKIDKELVDESSCKASRDLALRDITTSKIEVGATGKIDKGSAGNGRFGINLRRGLQHSGNAHCTRTSGK